MASAHVAVNCTALVGGGCDGAALHAAARRVGQILAAPIAPRNVRVDIAPGRYVLHRQLILCAPPVKVHVAWMAGGGEGSTRLSGGVIVGPWRHHGVGSEGGDGGAAGVKSSSEQ